MQDKEKLAGLIVTALTALLKGATATREALADSLEEAAAKVRNGDLIPDELLAIAKKDQAAIDTIMDSLD